MILHRSLVRRAPLALLAAAATVTAGFGLAPQSSATPHLVLAASSTATAGPAARHLSAHRSTAHSMAATGRGISGARHHVAKKRAPSAAARGAAETTVHRHVAPPAPKPVVKPAPKPVTKPTTTGASYPWAGASGSSLDDWGFTQRQCVSYAAWRLAKAGHAIDNSAGWGDASHWDSTARALGWTVSSTPHVGDVAQWNADEQSLYYASGASSPSGRFEAGGYGHVGYVTAVYGDGSVQVAQYNALSDRNYSSMHMTAPRYLHP